MPISRRRRGRAATQAARSGNLPTSTKRKKTNKLYLAASVVIATLVIASFAFASFSTGTQGGSGSANAYVEGVGVEYDIMSSAIHVPVTELVEYSTTPPTSGDHWQATNSPESCGFYEDGLNDESITHNLEHSNIVVSYNLPDEAQVDALKAAIDDIGLARTWGVIRSYGKIPEGQVALAAWGVLDTMEGIDPDRIETFFETYAGVLGPEFITC